jgi:hypothetical protein
MVAAGGVNADGSVDADDVAGISAAAVDAAAAGGPGAVAAWEITLPPGLVEATATVADSDVCVWVDPLVGS